jgi:ubiquinone/menaquinone biosynthesis C-methylase UbiE
MKDLNKEYWRKVSANETTSMPIFPDQSVLDHVHRGRVLDAGCGDGQLAEWLSEKGFLVFAIDINENAIENCRKKKTKVKYSLEDITEKLVYPDNFFDLICFKFTLANIHRADWPSLRKEVNRIIRPGGFVWLAEPLISDDYEKRYVLSCDLLNDNGAIFVFKDTDLASRIKNKEDLQNAIAKEEISRISRHYKKEELLDLFPGFEPVSEKIMEKISPSGYKLNTYIGLLKKEK